MLDFPHLPHVSIIIPVRNEQGFIRQNLAAVLTQTYPADKLEILVVDGQSDDNTPDIVQSLQTANPNLRLLENTARFTPQALNVGLRHSSGDIIIILGGHSEIAPDYVSCCANALASHDVDAVGGVIDTIGETYQSRAIALGMSSRFGVGDSTFRVGYDKPKITDTVVFGAYRRTIVERVGLFDEELIRNQDDEYNYRLRKLGGKLLFSPDIQSRYYSRSSLSKLSHQYYQYGFYKVRVMQKHPYQMRIRQLIPALFVMATLVGAALAPFSLMIRVLWIATIGSYLAANSFFSWQTARQAGFEYLRIMPLVFVTLHLSYGIGFLRGLVYWPFKKREGLL